eukprot:symbB.v1.2.034488.t1/scaffold4459.1/size39467/2
MLTSLSSNLRRSLKSGGMTRAYLGGRSLLTRIRCSPCRPTSSSTMLAPRNPMRVANSTRKNWKKLLLTLTGQAWVGQTLRPPHHRSLRLARPSKEVTRSPSLSRNELRKILIRGLTLAFTAGLFVPQVRQQDGYLWYIAQVDRFNPDNQVSLPEAELMAQAGAIAKKVGGSVVDLGSGSGNDFLTVQAAQAPELPLVAVEPNRFTWEKASLQAHDLGLAVSFAANLEEVPSNSCALLLTRRVLCSVDDQHAALMEIYRVLKPGGVFVFIEHVAAEEGSPLRLAQELSEWGGWAENFAEEVFRPVQQAMANNCDTARETEKAIRQFPWASIDSVSYDEAFNGPLTPHIRGLAVKG